MLRLGETCKFLSCPSKSHLHRQKKFYPFVKPWMDQEKCLRWIAATGRKDLTPVFIDKNSYVCEDHFVNGVPSAENPDPLPFDIVARIVNPSEHHPDENAHVIEDQDEYRVDDPSEHVAENSCAAEGYDAPFTENPDLLDCDFQTSTVNIIEQSNSPVRFSYPGKVITPGRQAALALKKKAISPRKTSRLNQAPYRPPHCRPNVTNVVKETSCEISEPLTEDVNSSVQRVGHDLPLTPNVISTGLPGADSSSPVAHSNNARNIHRKLFEEFMMDLADENDGITLSSHSYRDTSSGGREINYVLEKDNKCSVETQTWTPAYVNKLIAGGKLSKWRADISEWQTTEGRNVIDEEQGRRTRVETINSGWQITIVERDDEGGEPSTAGNANSGGDEMSGVRNTRTRWTGPTMDSDDDGEVGEAEKCERAPWKCFLSFETVNSDFEFEYLCGMSRHHFEVLYKYLGGDEVCSRLKYETVSGTPRQLRVSRLSLKCRLFMVLCRLRRGFTEVELSIFFGCSVSLVSRILNTWINFIYLEFKPLEERMFQDRKSQRHGMPQRFKSFKGLRVVIDCTEIKIETPSNFQQQGNTWSSYKHSNTVKYLIGINCHGAIVYVSEAFEGSMSDKDVFMQSTMYGMLRPGDVVMADRGFDIAHELDMIKVQLVIPSYLKGRDYLTPEEEIWSKKIARARIFVENAIGRIKMWRILNGTFPQSTLPLVSQMLFVCACLSNFQPPLL